MGTVTAGVEGGTEPFFLNIAKQLSQVIVEGSQFLAKDKGNKKLRLTFDDVYALTSQEELRKFLAEISTLKGKDDADRIISCLNRTSGYDSQYFAKINAGLNATLTELTTGNIGKIVGNSDSNRVIERLEKGKGIILVIQPGSLLSGSAAYPLGKVMFSQVKTMAGRFYASDSRLKTPLMVFMDEMQNILTPDLPDGFAKVRGVGVGFCGFIQSDSQLELQYGPAYARTLKDNCSTNIFFRVNDNLTAENIAKSLGEKKTQSAVKGIGSHATVRDEKEYVIDPAEIKYAQRRKIIVTTFSTEETTGRYVGETMPADDAVVKLIVPTLSENDQRGAS